MINYLEKLLDGQKVEWKPLGQVAEVSSGNSAPQNQDFFLGGIYPFCRTSDVGRVHHSVNFSEIQDKLNQDGIKGLRLFPKETILLPKSGASTLLNHRVMLSVDSYVSSHLATIYRKEEFVLAKYLFYFLSRFDISQLIPDKSYPSLKISEIAKIEIPIPPLSVQKEIVKILDKMTELEAALEAELTLRRKQYHYYRDKLLSENELAKVGFEWKTLGEAGAFIRGKRFVKADMVEYGEVPCIHYGEMYTYYGVWANQTKSFLTSEVAKDLRFAEKGDIVIVAAGETIEDIGRGTAWLGNERVAIHDACFIFRSEINNKYLAYFFRTEFFHNQIKKYISSGKISAIHAKGLEKVRIPVPSLSHQTKIVTILDKFDTLTQSISEGLPHEIALRRKQYEYYREQLLNF